MIECSLYLVSSSVSAKRCVRRTKNQQKEIDVFPAGTRTRDAVVLCAKRVDPLADCRPKLHLFHEQLQTNVPLSLCLAPKHLKVNVDLGPCPLWRGFFFVFTELSVGRDATLAFQKPIYPDVTEPVTGPDRENGLRPIR